MLYLALNTLRARGGVFAASFLVLSLGTAIVLACGGLMETGVTTSDNLAGSVLVPLSAVFGGITVMVAVFVVASTLGLSIQLRLRELALLRAIGSTPFQLRRLIMAETLLIAFLATAVGYFPGRLFGQLLLDQIAASGAISSNVAYRQGFVPAVVAIGASLVTAIGAAFIASRRAAVTEPTEALAEAELQQRWLSGMRLTFAIICLASATALSVVTALVISGPVAASTAGPSAMLWASGLALLAPGITRLLTVVLRGPMRALSGTAGHLAMLNADARTVRMAGSVTPVMLAIGLATALLYIQIADDDLTGAWINLLLVSMIVIYTVISLLNTLVMATTQRQREFALQRLIGSTPGQVLRMVVLEAVLIALIGIALGTVIAMATLVPFAVAIDGSLIPPGPTWIYLTVVGSALLITTTTAALAGLFALQRTPIVAASVVSG